ncbi:MAG: alpha/beta fold hydrolase [Polyangiaceae bacterium]
MRTSHEPRAPAEGPLPSTSPGVPVAMPGRHRFTRVEGVDLHWAEFGKPSGKPPLVLLHGLNDCYLTWRAIAPLLATDRLVLVPDLPGHGLSGRPDASYELRWYAHVMARWFEALALDGVDVVGHSFGGGVAQVLLLECPGRVRRLVLVSSGGLGREIAPSLRLAAIPFVVERLGQPFMGPGTRLALKATGDVLSNDEIRALGAMNAQRGSARAFARTVRDIIDWRGQRHTFFEHTTELSHLPAIAVFWGNRDSVIPPAHAQALAGAVEGVRVVLFDGCGHYPHHEQPDAFMLALRNFLDDPAAPKARLREARAEQPRSLLSSWLAPSRPPLLWQKGGSHPPLGRSTGGAARGADRPSEASSSA